MNVLGAIKVLSIALLAPLLFSCAAAVPKVITAPAGPVDFKQYKTVKLAVLDSVMTTYSREGIPLLEGWLKDLLQSQGYAIVESQEDMRIEVAVTSFQPGRKFFGMYIWSYGFGKNMPALTYRATIGDRSGSQIAELEGGKSYHGYELTGNPDYMTEEQIRTAMIRHSVTQIGRFIQNNGKLE